jgi:LysM repeat protein
LILIELFGKSCGVMKPTLLIATLSMAFASPSAFAKSELETLRSLCAEQRRQINELKAANERLRADAHPTKAPAKSDPTPAVIDKPAAAAKTNTSASTSATYTVKAGDNFEKIARKVGASPVALAKANRMKTSSIIHPGQKLKVPGTTAPPVAAPKPVAETASTPKSPGKTHKVQTGETLASISKKHGMSTQAIVAANPKVKPTSLRPGQVVSLGGSTSSTTMISAPARSTSPAAVETAPSVAPAAVTKSQPVRESTPASTAPPANSTVAAAEVKSAPAPAQPPAAAQETPPASTAEKKIRPITIDGEMTYGEFATKYGTDAERLNALNGLDLTTATVLAKGSELYVPAQP